MTSSPSRTLATTTPATSWTPWASAAAVSTSMRKASTSSNCGAPLPSGRGHPRPPVPHRRRPLGRRTVAVSLQGARGSTATSSRTTTTPSSATTAGPSAPSRASPPDRVIYAAPLEDPRPRTPPGLARRAAPPPRARSSRSTGDRPFHVVVPPGDLRRLPQQRRPRPPPAPHPACLSAPPRCPPRRARPPAPRSHPERRRRRLATVVSLPAGLDEAAVAARALAAGVRVHPLGNPTGRRGTGRPASSSATARSRRPSRASPSDDSPRPSARRDPERPTWAEESMGDPGA